MKIKMYSFVILLFGLLLISGCGGGNASDPEPITDSEEDAFGFGGIQMDGQPAEGTRPVLVMLENDSRFAPSSHDASYFDNLFFGSGDKTLVGYFSEMSNGIFTWSRAGVIGPINYTMPADIIADLEFVDNDEDAQAVIRARGDRKNVTRIIQAAIDSGFDFSPYDTNGDNVIWQRELVVARVVNDDSPGGSLRGGLTCPTQTRAGQPDLEVCVGVILLGEHVGIATIGHELAHSVGRGMDELYGSAGLSQNYTLMGATIFGGDDDRQVFHLDPHFKMRLGWMQPRISTLIQSAAGNEGRFGSCTSIAPAQAYLGGTGSLNPIILYDVVRGTNEYLMLDYRNPDMGGYDADVPSKGLGIWYVKTSDDHSLQRITPGIGGCCDDATNFLLFSPDGTRGSGASRQLWNNSDGIFTLNWTLDNSPTNVYFGVSPQPLSNSIFEVEWATGGALVPRVEEGLSGVTAVHGGLVSISGVLGAEDFGIRTVGLTTDGTDFYPMDVQSWRCAEITARVPPGVPAGVYEMRVYADAARTTWDNFRQVTVDDLAPTVEIVSPGAGDRFSEAVDIVLEGESFDPGVGSLEDDQVSWYLDGIFFRNGHSSSIPAGRLSPGSHQVRFDGTDGVSTASTNINIIIDAVVVGVNTPPSAQITSHSDPASVYADTSDAGGWYKMVTFTGTGDDAEDGVLSGASLQWTVRDSGGAVVASGAGNSLTAKLYSVCNVATYSVELTATDSEGEPGSDMLDIFDVHLLC